MLQTVQATKRASGVSPVQRCISAPVTLSVCSCQALLCWHALLVPLQPRHVCTCVTKTWPPMFRAAVLCLSVLLQLLHGSVDDAGGAVLGSAARHHSDGPKDVSAAQFRSDLVGYAKRNPPPPSPSNPLFQATCWAQHFSTALRLSAALQGPDHCSHHHADHGAHSRVFCPLNPGEQLSAASCCRPAPAVAVTQAWSSVPAVQACLIRPFTVDWCTCRSGSVGLNT